MEQVRRSNTVIYGEHYISTIKLRTMRCITTTNKFSGIRFCFGIFVSRNKGFILNYLNRTCTSYILVFLGVTLCLYFFCVCVKTKYHTLQPAIWTTDAIGNISTSHGMTGRNFFDVFLPFHLLFGF
jgi:hypothetical protein